MNILTSKQLLEQQLSDIKPRKVKPVEASKRTGQDYNVTLQRMVNTIRKDVNQSIVPLLRKLSPLYQADAMPVMDGWADDILAALSLLRARWTSPDFRALVDQVASQFVRTADDVNRKRFNDQMGRFGIDVFANDADLLEYLQIATATNSQLITSIADQYLERVQMTVMTNVRSGARSSAIVSQLAKDYGITTNRAKMIARDQTAKVNGEINKRRQTAAGFPYFQWLDSGDERVRDRHEAITDKVTAYGKGIYRWDNPPLSDDGRPIIPGQDYQCRCGSRPVSQREVDENVKAGRTRPGVKR